MPCDLYEFSRKTSNMKNNRDPDFRFSKMAKGVYTLTRPSEYHFSTMPFG